VKLTIPQYLYLRFGLRWSSKTKARAILWGSYLSIKVAMAVAIIILHYQVQQKTQQLQVNTKVVEEKTILRALQGQILARYTTDDSKIALYCEPRELAFWKTITTKN
jgi:mannitol-specific phosphotransferase system IIBC component